MRDAISSLSEIATEWTANKFVPEVDWARIRTLDFQELLQARTTLFKRLEGRECALCADFLDHVSMEDCNAAASTNIIVQI